MTITNAAAASPEATAEARKVVLKEIDANWSKFCEKTFPRRKGATTSSTSSNQVRLEKTQAQRDVGALLKGRHI
jgi:hypothetical protein